MKKTVYLLTIVLLAISISGCKSGQDVIEKNEIKTNAVETTENENNKDTSDESKNLVGGDQDEHGCIGSAGYTWCPSKEKCLRAWEEYCEEYKENFRGNNSEIPIQ